MTDSVRALKEMDYNVNKAVTGKASVEFIDGALVFKDNGKKSYFDEKQVRSIGDPVDIFILAARANQNYTDLKSDIDERQKKGNVLLAYPRGFESYPQKSEISDDYKDPYKKFGVV